MDNVNSSVNTDMIEIKRIFSEMFRHKIEMLIIIAVCIIGSIGYAKFLLIPKYVSYAKIYAVNQNSNNISTSELAISTYLTRDGSELIADRVVLNEVISQLGLKYSYEQLKSCINISTNQETRFISIAVTMTDPAEAQRVASKICEVSKAKFTELLGVDWVKVTDEASIAAETSSNSATTYALYGLVIGLIFSFGYLMLVHYKNDKISGAQDAEQCLGVCTLATITYNYGKKYRTTR